MVPEKPGRYWIRHGKLSEIIFVYQYPGLPCEVRMPFGGRDGTQWRTVKDFATHGWEWGEAIPDSPTLKAMREVVARDPSAYDEDGKRYCRYCDTMLDEYDHLDKCVWQRSQEKQDADTD